MGGNSGGGGSYIPTASSVQAEAVQANKTNEKNVNSSNASILSASTQENINTTTLGLSSDAKTKKNKTLGG